METHIGQSQTIIESNQLATEQRDKLIKKIQEINLRVINLREMVTDELDSLTLIEESAVIRTCLDELEKLVFERYSRECFLSTVDQGEEDVSRLLVILNRLFK